MKKRRLGMDVGIDLGSTSVKIYTPDRQIALDEPTMVAVDRDTDEILAFGSDARHMLGRTPERIAVSMGRETLSLTGDNLRLQAMNAGELLITGRIRAAEWG